MSRETAEWLNTMTLIGYKEKRGNAWHYRAEYQGDEPNHYEGPVPVEDVVRRLFSWQAKAAPLQFTMPERITEDGVTGAEQVTDDTRQVIYNGNTGEVFYVASDGYAIHQYDEWLLQNVANLLDDDLGIASAGLLCGGGVGWVQVELPEPVAGPGGFDFRPFLLGLTSHNGTKATGYKVGKIAVVCDNTLTAAERENGGELLTVKHTRNSALRIADARDAMGLIVAERDASIAELDGLLSVKVDDVQWQKFLDTLVPMTDDMSARGRTLAENKLGELNRLYKNDIRVAPWKGTGLGVMQAVNTFDQHVATMRNLGDGNKGQARFGRTLLATADGSLAKETNRYRTILAAVTDSKALTNA